MRGNAVENSMIDRIDFKRNRRELRGKGQPAEELVLAFLNSKVPGFKTRLSTQEEDKGIKEGGKAIDTVSYIDDKPVMVSQITTDTERGGIAKKLEEMEKYPFVRLDEMKREDMALPKVLIYLDVKQVASFTKEPDFEQHPEIAIQIIDSSSRSLKFDLAKTKNPLEQNAITRLIQLFEEERKKYIH